MVGFETIICRGGLEFILLQGYGRINPKPYDPNDGDDDEER